MQVSQIITGRASLPCTISIRPDKSLHTCLQKVLATTLATHASKFSSINPFYGTQKPIVIVGSLKTYDAKGQFWKTMKGPLRQTKGPKSRISSRGDLCLLEKSEMAKSKAQSLLCQITGWKLELVSCTAMFLLYSVRDLDDARETWGLCPHF